MWSDAGSCILSLTTIQHTLLLFTFVSSEIVFMTLILGSFVISIFVFFIMCFHVFGIILNSFR